MEIYDFGEISAYVTAAMREYTQPFVASISRAISYTEGEQQGSGGYIELRGKPHLITNEHVSSAMKMRPLVHHLAQEAYGVRITNPFYEERFPIDLAITRIDDVVWNGPNEKKALPAQRIAVTHNPVEHELLFITGFSGERSRFSPLLETLFSTGTPYLTQERQLPSSWQSPRWFSLFYTPPNTTSLDPAAPGLPDPHGFSGSLVWDSKAALCLKTGTEWHPDLAEVTGIIWGWDSKDPCLLAIRAEFLREFLLNALRNEAAYFHWLLRGQPENDDWADWFLATTEIPYLS